ncbi:MAG: hypothetical protein GQ582_13160 [Methyloprofundus sp.]|nr:hypothetical protein [Methyloprofundus sp.]
MNEYLIQAINSSVRVSRIIDGELEAIRNKGDFAFPLSDFWRLFKEKIEYEVGEQLALIVLTDDKYFELDASIVIAEKFTSENEVLNDLVSSRKAERYYLMTYPELALDYIKAEPDLSVTLQASEPEFIAAGEGQSIQDFFKKKTRDIKRGV